MRFKLINKGEPARMKMNVLHKRKERKKGRRRRKQKKKRREERCKTKTSAERVRSTPVTTTDPVALHIAILATARLIQIEVKKEKRMMLLMMRTMMRRRKRMKMKKIDDEDVRKKEEREVTCLRSSRSRW